ncbi:MAG: hypothetical protein ACI9P7_000639 [Candidatus Azotimanducaceae bacterium]
MADEIFDLTKAQGVTYSLSTVKNGQLVRDRYDAGANPFYLQYSNIICRILSDVIGGGASGMLRFMNDELFEPIGVRLATPKFDTSGTFIGSSYLLASPHLTSGFCSVWLVVPKGRYLGRSGNSEQGLGGLRSKSNL